jgi:hypothetical protein
MRNTNRRDFLRSGGGALGAGVAAATGMGAATAEAATPVDAAVHAAAREAIRHVHRDFLAASAADNAAVTYRPRIASQPDRIAVADDGRSAQAVFHVEAETVTPLEGESTLVRMARLQGHVAERRIEAGQLEAEYVKRDDTWQIATLRFVAA